MRVLLIITFLFISSVLFAQRQSGAIEGSVKDFNGEPIPGVTVVASSPSLIGGNSGTFTDQNGYYRFPYLASGHYEVKAELQGFQTVCQKDIQLSVGETLTVDFRLVSSTTLEVVEVIDKPPLIDVSTTAVSHEIPSEIIHNLPRIENIQYLMALTPGVSDDLVAYGSEGTSSNSVWIDGVYVSDPRRKDLVVKYNYNWIDEVQVIGIGAPAEYGGFTGVLGNFITRSGGNQFHGLFETFFQNEDLASRNVPNPGPEQPFSTYDISAQLGGPILKDKFWFFSGIQYPHEQTLTPGFDELKTEIYQKVITKLTYKLNENNNLQGFANWNKGSFEKTGSNAYALPEANYAKSKTPQWSWNATWISLLDSQTTLDARFGGFYHHYKDIEEHPDLSAHWDQATGIRSVNSNARVDDKRTRIQTNAILSHHARNFITGSHDFRFGVEFENSDAVFSYQYNGGMQYIDYNGALNLRFVGANYIFDGGMNRVSTYAQDEWNLTERFNVSVGVRWDHNRAHTDRGTVIKTDPIAPRVGFVWILNKENQTVIKAHYGDYYDALSERFYYLLSSGENFEPLSIQKYINGDWVEQERYYPRKVSVKGELKHPYVRQFTIGIDRILPGDIPIGGHYIYRRWGNILEDIGQNEYEPVPFVNPISGETITVYNLTKSEFEKIFTNPEGIYRQYHGFELFTNKRFGNKLSLSASVVFSRLTGNYFGQSNGGGLTFTVFLDDPNFQINREGRLGMDRTLNWKVIGTYSLPLGLNTGFYFRHESGDTWTAQVPVYGLNQGDITILGEPLGSRRLPSRNLLDLRVEKEFPIYNGQFRATLDIFNVFNSAYVLGVTDYFPSPNFGNPGNYTQPRQMRVGLRYTF